MANIPASMYITHLEREGAFIKVWGQTNRSLPIAIEKALQQMTPQFEQGMYSPAIENFQVGIMCCAKFKDNLYYRARITNVAYLTQGMVEVLFVDYGNRDVISCMNTRTLSGMQSGLISIPAQAKDFILASVTLPNWDLNNFELICSELRYLEFQLVPLLEIGPYTLISLYLNKQEVTESLVERGLLLKIPIQFQQITLQPLIARTNPPGLPITPQHPQMPIAMPSIQPKIVAPVSQPVSTPTLLTFKALPLENNSEHEIYVSYVSDGPCLFSVQLKRMEEQLKRLMTEINSIELQPLEEYPLPGTVCLAQSSEDEYMCRAVVTSMVDGQYKVFYVDFGNTELLPFDKLFQIPFKYVIPKVMATRFALAGLENSSVSIEIKCKFKDFVNNRPLFMKVKPAATKSALPLCDLWDENNIRALDMIKQAALISYPEQTPLSRGFNQDVKVCFVHSCNKVFVQLKSKEQELEQLMNNLQETCYNIPTFDLQDVRISLPCCVLFPDDGLWYRGEIVEIDDTTCKVKYVDFGNDSAVRYEDVKVPLPEHVTALRPQAIECCLNGYQNIEPDEQRDLLLEELIHEQDLSMRVVEMQGGKALIDLYDKQHYNIASLLMEKVATATSMVSPLLIQDNHRIEQRKRSPPNGNQNSFKDKKPLRELNNRNQDNPQENWRQNKFPRDEDNSWNSQKSPADTQNNFYNTNKRHNEPDWKGSEGDGNKHNFDYNKRSDNQRRNFSSPDNKRNDEYGNGNFENKSFYPRGKRDFKPRDDFDNKDFNRKGGFEKRDGFEKTDGYEKKGFKKFDRQQTSPNQGQDDYGRANKNFDSRSGNESFSKPRNRDYNNKKDGSEKSWSDASERSWKKGPKTFNKPRNDQFGGSRKGFSSAPFSEIPAQKVNWGSNASPTCETGSLSPNATTYDYAADTAKFKTHSDLSGTNELVYISWFYNPTQFYSQLDKYKDAFKQMMEEIQSSYRNRRPTSLKAGAPALARFAEDGALYRAEILNCQFNQYHVKYVDYGNVATVNKVYPIETKYMELPMQAISCGLQGISPVNDDWPSPDNFSSFFDKDCFDSQFMSLADDRYYVDLIHNGKSVSTLLTESSLARSTQPPPDVNVNLLVNQQVVAVLRDVISLNEITLQVDNIVLPAKIHNLEMATETHEDQLKEWVGHFVITYVDGILEDRLEVTLYDLTGQKLQIVVPDEGAYDEIEPLCPWPIYTNELHGWVSHVTVESIYLQFSEEDEQQLSNSLYEHYTSVPQEEGLAPAEGQTYAVLSSDSMWYRGSITEIKDDQVVVTYIDYGNTELVPIANLRELSPQFYRPHILAVEVLLPGEKQQYLDRKVNVSVTCGSLGWEGTIVSVDEAEVDDANVPEPELQEKAMEAKVQEETITTTEGVVQEESPQQSIGVSVVISHIDSPSEFYLQLTEASESISQLQQELQQQVATLPNLENPTAGALCAAPYSVCQEWYRAQVLDADDDITTVRFVDFGNTDVITNADVNVKTLPTEMLSIEYHAKFCSLNVSPIGEEWSPAAIDMFENYASSANLTAEIIHQDEKTTYVELYSQGKSVGEILKENDMAVDLELENESGSTGFISHMNSPSEFWIQLESSCQDLEWVADQLSGADNYPVLEDLTPGSLCAAIFSGDDSWYRARILSNTVAGLEVIFIDYGNSCSCDGLRELPEDLIMLPPLALKCSLQKPNGVLQWSQDATEKFKEISADGATIFNVNVLTAGETSIVQLARNGMDVSQQLLPETKQCFVTHIDALDSFWVQFMDDNAKIENLTAEMENAESWPAVTEPQDNELVAALSEDGAFYRARVLDKSLEGCNCFFVDYGNKSISTEMKKLPEEYATLGALATNYKLETLPRTKWSEKSEELFGIMADSGVAMFEAEIVSENTLRLYLNGADIRSNLECERCTPAVSLQSSPKKAPLQALEPTLEVELEKVLDETSDKNISGENVVGDQLEEIIETAVSTSEEHKMVETKELVGKQLEEMIKTAVEVSSEKCKSQVAVIEPKEFVGEQLEEIINAVVDITCDNRVREEGQVLEQPEAITVSKDLDEKQLHEVTKTVADTTSDKSDITSNKCDKQEGEVLEQPKAIIESKELVGKQLHEVTETTADTISDKSDITSNKCDKKEGEVLEQPKAIIESKELAEKQLHEVTEAIADTISDKSDITSNKCNEEGQVLEQPKAITESKDLIEKQLYEVTKSIVDSTSDKSDITESKELDGVTKTIVDTTSDKSDKENEVLEPKTVTESKEFVEEHSHAKTEVDTTNDRSGKEPSEDSEQPEAINKTNALKEVVAGATDKSDEAESRFCKLPNTGTDCTKDVVPDSTEIISHPSESDKSSDASAKEITGIESDKPECDISNEDLLKSVAKNKNVTESNCTKPVENVERNLIVETSDIGHSPEDTEKQ